MSDTGTSNGFLRLLQFAKKHSIILMMITFICYSCGEFVFNGYLEARILTTVYLSLLIFLSSAKTNAQVRKPLKIVGFVVGSMLTYVLFESMPPILYRMAHEYTYLVDIGGNLIGCIILHVMLYVIARYFIGLKSIKFRIKAIQIIEMLLLGIGVGAFTYYIGAGAIDYYSNAFSEMSAGQSMGMFIWSISGDNLTNYLKLPHIAVALQILLNVKIHFSVCNYGLSPPRKN